LRSLLANADTSVRPGAAEMESFLGQLGGPEN